MKYVLRIAVIIGVMIGVVFIIQGAGKNDTVIYVSPTGSNQGSGSIQKPYATLEKAISVAKAGDTILLREGVYYGEININKSGSKEKGYIRIQNYKNEKPIIDLTNADDKNKEVIGLLIRDQSYIIIDGLTVRNAISSRNTTYGIRITGKGDNIKVRNCEIYNIEGYGKAMAHPIVVAGNDTKKALRNITINNNHIHNCSTNNSEQLTVAGNAEEIYVYDNLVEDCSNIGICVIGNYGTCKNPKLNQPRQVVVKGNKVRNCIQTTYEYHCGGIYVDGAREVTVDGNEVWQCDYGIKVSAEKNGLVVRDVVIKNNYIHGNNIGAINVGVWKEEPPTSYNIEITGNRIIQEDQGEYENQAVFLIYKCRDVQIANNNIKTEVKIIETRQCFTSAQETKLSFDNNRIANITISEKDGIFAKYPEKCTYNEFISIVNGENNVLNN